MKDIQKHIDFVKELFGLKAFVYYFILNGIVVWGVGIFIFLRNIDLHGILIFLTYLLLSSEVIVIQYFPVKRTRRWVVKVLYYFLSMFGCLFVLGMVIGLFSDPFEFMQAGFFLAVVGSMFAIVILPVFPVLVLLNWLFRKQTSIG